MSKWNPGAGLLAAAALMPFALLTGSPVHAQTYTVLHNFTGGAHDGANPQGPLIENAKHQFYGASLNGGRYGYGTVFKLNKTGKSSVLNSFAYYNGWDPTSGVIQGSDGNLYGTTWGGGYGYGQGQWNSGVLFELDQGKKAKLLYQFSVEDGQSSPNGLTADALGNLYGVAAGGPYGAGFIYEFDTAGSFSVLYNFTGGNDGTTPQGPLAWGPDNDLYGVTKSGGANAAGTVFKMDITGNLTTLYAFVRGTGDGYTPNPGTLAFDAQGNIYGTTQYGGTGTACSRGCGTVFEVTPTGSESVAYSFQGGAGGGYPLTQAVIDSAGNIYGTTSQYGDQTCACGVLFRLDDERNETVLHTWTGTDGSRPSGQLLLSEGRLYGLTAAGGASNEGVAFRWSPK
jgi:uncharacterized repeat protein (TIGR03803 family)